MIRYLLISPCLRLVPPRTATTTIASSQKILLDYLEYLNLQGHYLILQSGVPPAFPMRLSARQRTVQDPELMGG